MRKYSHISEDGQAVPAGEGDGGPRPPSCGKPGSYEGKRIGLSGPAVEFVMWKNDRFWTSRRKEMTRKMAADLLKRGRTSVKGMWSEKERFHL